MVEETSLGGQNARFGATPWTLVLRGDRDSLDRLVTLYWKPVYFYLRRHGRDIESAKDLTQGFWGTMLERASLAHADPSRGRFRTFLLAALQNFLRDEHRAASREKRGGGISPLSFDFEEGERRYALEPAATDPPEASFNRQWARALLQQAVDDLKPPYLEAVRLHLAGESDIATRLGVSATDARNYVHRGRGHLREILIARIRETVHDPDQLETEIAEFLRSIR